MARALLLAALALACLTPKLARAQCAAAGNACNDGMFCTVDDTCTVSLECVGTPRVCNDGDPCTDNRCNESANECQFPPASMGTACSDGEFCTTPDTCDGSGNCIGGAPRDCDDGRDCTIDSCNELGDNCINDLQNACIIRGNCEDEGAADPADPCMTCQPEVRTNMFVRAPVGTECGAAMCMDGQLTPAGTCDAAGSCTNAAAPTPCPSGICGTPDACAECNDDADCGAGQYCESMVCVDALDNGSDCDRGTMCRSGLCTGGQCCMCAAACLGPCETLPDASMPPMEDSSVPGVDGSTPPPPSTNLEPHGSGLCDCRAAPGSTGSRLPTLAIVVFLLALCRRRHVG